MSYHPPSNNYDVVYSVGILDDIHNYFPALLYDQGQFQSVPHVFHYVRRQMNSRFNLYAHGANLYRNLNQPAAPPPVPTVPPQTANTDGLSLLYGLLSNPGFFTQDYDVNRIFTPLNVRTRIIPTPDVFMEPVIVRPGDDIIQRNTQIVTGTNIPAGASCAICQDVMLGSETCRKLTVCGHLYHKTCIDQWFQTNVHCPTCRHDIREIPRNHPARAATASAPAPAPGQV